MMMMMMMILVKISFFVVKFASTFLLLLIWRIMMNINKSKKVALSHGDRAMPAVGHVNRAASDIKMSVEISGNDTI